MSANRCPNSKCEYFNRVLPNNAKVCPMCGTPLGNAIAHNNSSPPKVVNQTEYPAITPPLPPPTPPAYPPPATPPPPAYPPAAAPPTYLPPSSPRPVLRLMHSSGREFRFFSEDGYIGRRSQMSGRIPEIDLFGIPNEGVVSRTHARVYWDGNQNAYMIMDNSRNGTYLNGNLLASGVPYRLSNGDLVQLGQNNLVSFTVAMIF